MEILVILGVIALAALVIIGIYNRLVALRQNRHNAFADIDVQLKQRLDLVPALVETVKGYAAHESKLFETVTAARAGVKNAGNTEERLAAENVLGTAMRGFYAVAENYPQLKADANFQKLMAELSDIENKIAAARRFFNNATAEYNTAIEQFPANLFAPRFGFKPELFYEVSDAERAIMDTPPAVKFGT
jgi:LemA protein